MKTRTCIAFIFLFMIKFASAQEQESILDKKISITIENQTIETILKSIEEIGGLKIGYSNQPIDINKTVSVNFKNKPVKDILRSLFSQEKFSFKVINNRILIVNKKREINKKYTLSGYIKEEGSEEHLLGVSIYIPELGVGSISNSYGFYSLTVSEGSYDVFFSYMGYGTITKTINMAHDQKLTINMKTASENLDEVVITSNKKIKESRITQMSAVRLNPLDVQDVPTLLGEKDVLKTLQLLPGIQGGAEGTSGFYVRGGTPDQNLIILDDATVYNASHLLGAFSVFNGDAIKSIEVYKGGFPARFGGRLSSVLKIDMKDGNKEKFSGKASIGLISSSLLFEGPINKGKTSFLFSARRTYADLIIKPLQSKDYEVVGYHFTDFNLKLHHVFNTKNKLFWSNYFGEDTYTNDYNADGEKSKDKLWWGNITSTLRWNHEFNQKLFSNTSLIFSHYSLNVLERYHRGDDKYELKTSSGINDLSAKIDFNYYPNSEHSIKFGAINTFHGFTPQHTSIKESQRNNASYKQVLNSIESALYIEDDWKITSKLNISPGLRFSYYKYKSVQYYSPEPRISVAWRIKEGLAIKGSYSKMNQYIHLLTNAGIGLPTDLWVSTTEKVKPQKSEQFAVGIAKDFEESGYSLTVETYYKKLKDVIAYKEGNSFFSVENTNITKNWEDNTTLGKGWAYGAELLFRKQKGLLTGWFGYTLAWSQRQFDELNLGRKFNARYDRRHDVSLVGIYKPSKKITLSGTWVFSSGNNYTLPDSKTLSTISNFPINLGGLQNSSNTLSNKRNNFRGESTHRLDLGIQFHKKTRKGRDRTWDFSIYNTYARKNPFSYAVKDPDYLSGNEYVSSSSERVLVKTSVFMITPSITYTIKF